jgi:thimet oligopeptidase
MKTKPFAALALALAAASLFSQDLPVPIKQALDKADAGIAKIIAVKDSERTFDNTLGALDKILSDLDRDTSLFVFMQFVSTNAAERDAARAADEAISNWTIELGKREDLYKAVKAYADTNPKLEGEQARLLMFTMRDYRRAGMNLPPQKRAELTELQKNLNKLEIEFGQNIAEDETRVALMSAELKGVPQETLQRHLKMGEMYLIRLDGSTYSSIMENCSNAATREKCWVMYRRRGGQRNVRVLEKILKLRYQEAKMLGYDNVVDYQIETRMAKNAATVKKFYDDLIPIVKKKADADFEEFNAIKRKDTKDPKAVLNPWDYAYYKRMLEKTKYKVDGEKVREYFSMEDCMKGLFSITASLYGIEYKDVTSQAASLGLPIWHPEVKLYEVVDKTTGETLGHIYTDLFPREDKYSHAACWGLRGRRVNEDGTVDKPLCALVCNFAKPSADKPSLLPHDEVETLFHEFGHALHGVLTQVHYGRFSGTAVARDFVEAPSQMMENWVWDPKVLATFAKHYKTGAPIPASLLDGMNAARTLGSGLETEGQLFLGLMDQAFHLAPEGSVDTTKVANQIYETYTHYKAVPGTMFQAAFTHLTGYQGAYYGYLWSLVYAQDMFQRFEQLGVLSPETGAYYRQRVLAKGGSEDEMQMLREYLGREPSMDAFYRHLGLKK